MPHTTLILSIAMLATACAGEPHHVAEAPPPQAIEDAASLAPGETEWARFPFIAGDTMGPGMSPSAAPDGHGLRGVRVNQSAQEVHAYIHLPPGSTVHAVEVYGEGNGEAILQADLHHYPTLGAHAEFAAARVTAWPRQAGRAVASWTAADQPLPVRIGRGNLLTARVLYVGDVPDRPVWVSHVSVMFSRDVH